MAAEIRSPEVEIMTVENERMPEVEIMTVENERTRTRLVSWYRRWGRRLPRPETQSTIRGSKAQRT